MTRDYLADLSPAWAEKEVYIPNGTRVARFEEVASRRRRDGELLRVMYVGAMGVTNGLDLVLEAMRIVERREPGLLECVLIGSGPEKPRLRQMARDWGLSSVRFEEPVPRAEVPSVTAQSDMLILVQREVFYGSSNKLFDYMASAKPIVFAIFAEHNNPVKEVGCGVSASPKDAEDLAEKLISVAHMSDDERRTMGERGASYVRRHHDYGVLAQRLQSSIKELLDGTREVGSTRDQTRN
jgi:glycosyltransferase involved in cell wall biosynthesis